MADKFHRALIKKADAKGLEGKARKKFIAEGLAKDTRTLDRQIRAKRGATTIRKALKVGAPYQISRSASIEEGLHSG